MPPAPATPAEALAWLERQPASTIRLGLDRVQEALAQLGHPQRRLRVVQVAGTNGKGSTCAFIDAVLRAAGHRVGLYTSPHLERVNERFRVGGEEISDALLGQRLLEVIARCPQAVADPPALTYFEVGTLVALWHFACEQVDVAVLETGLGGRLDATTAAGAEVTAITSISFDHMQYLGGTLAAIAAEKAGILRAGAPVAVAPQPPQALEVIAQRAAELGAPLYLAGRDFALGDDGRFEGLGVTLEGVKPELRGAHQLENAAVAVATVLLLGRRGVAVPAEAVVRGVRAARWPGRLEVVQRTPEVVLDGAHNEGGAVALRRALDTLYAGRAVHLVFGVLADKDHATLRRALFPRCASVHLCPAPSPRTLPPEAHLEDARRMSSEAAVYPSVDAALAGALARAAPEDVVVCAGSLYVVGDARAALGREGSKE